MTSTKLRTTSNKRIRLMITGGILTAISIVLMLFGEFVLPIFPGWLKVDISALPAMIGSFAMGPVMGVVIILAKNLIHFLIKGLAQDMGLGNVADIIVCLTLVLPAALVYKYNKTRKGAVLGLALGSVLATVIGGPLANLIVFPGYVEMYFKGIAESMFQASQATNQGVISLWTYMLYVVVPFNLLKAVIVSIATFAVYKPLSPILHRYK